MTIAVAWVPAVWNFGSIGVAFGGERLSEFWDGLPEETVLSAQGVRGSVTTWLMFDASDHNARVAHLLGVTTPSRPTGPRLEDSLRGWERAVAWSHFLAKARLPFRPGGVSTTARIEARGWPCRALFCEYTMGFHNPYSWDVLGGAFTLRSRYARSSPMNTFVPNTLPYYPIWTGLLANIAFWSLAVAPLVFAMPYLRARLRRVFQRPPPGICAACGYDLSGLPNGAPCPECGVAPAPR